MVDKTGQFQWSPQFGIFGGKENESDTNTSSKTSSSGSSSTTKHAHTTTSLSVNEKLVSYSSSKANVTSVVASTTLHITAGTGIAPHVSGSTGSVSVIHRNSTKSLTYHRSTKTTQVIKTGTAATTSGAAATTTSGAPTSQSSNFAVAGNAIATQAGIALAGVWGIAALVL